MENCYKVEDPRMEKEDENNDVVIGEVYLH